MVIDVVRVADVRCGAVDESRKFATRLEQVDRSNAVANLREDSVRLAAVLELGNDLRPLRAADIHPVIHRERHDVEAGVVQHVVVAEEDDFGAAARVVNSY